MVRVEPTVSVDFWGDYACFTSPLNKVERHTYDVPTPSSVRGMLDSIYMKPSEFYWSVRKIEVLRPIRHMSCKRNEVKVKTSGLRPINVEQVHTPRTSVILKDVKYRVTAVMVPHDDDPSFVSRVYDQAVRRIESGQCFKQPYLGMREFTAFFAPSDFSEEPVRVSRDFGIMVFDTHVPGDGERGGSGMDLSLYRCLMDGGVIYVPAYDSPEVTKVGGVIHV